MLEISKSQLLKVIKTVLPLSLRFETDQSSCLGRKIITLTSVRSLPSQGVLVRQASVLPFLAGKQDDLNLCYHALTIHAPVRLSLIDWFEKCC